MRRLDSLVCRLVSHREPLRLSSSNSRFVTACQRETRWGARGKEKAQVFWETGLQKERGWFATMQDTAGLSSWRQGCNGRRPGRQAGRGNTHPGCGPGKGSRREGWGVALTWCTERPLPRRVPSMGWNRGLSFVCVGIAAISGWAHSGPMRHGTGRMKALCGAHVCVEAPGGVAWSWVGGYLLQVPSSLRSFHGHKPWGPAAKDEAAMGA